MTQTIKTFFLLLVLLALVGGVVFLSQDVPPPTQEVIKVIPYESLTH